MSWGVRSGQRAGRALTIVVAVFAIIPAAQHASADRCITYPAVIEDERVDSFELDGVPVNVLRPAGYDTSGMRYPVLYLLHGSIAHAEEAWLNDSDVIEFTSGLGPGRGAIVIMPGGDLLGFRIDWQNGRYTPERFMVDRLVPYIDTTYRTTAGREHRAVAGLSGGGYGALHLAARHPDVFAATGSFSGSGDLIDMAGPSIGLAEAAVLGGYEAACRDQVDPFPACGGDELCWRNQNPGDVARNLGTVSTYVATGNGVPCDAEDAQDLLNFERPYYQLEPVIKAWNDRLHSRFVEAGLAHVYDTPSCGVHTWRYWNRYLRTFWDQMFEAFGGSSLGTFDHRSADPSFSVWGWTFEADPARAAEFLDITDASCAGLGLTGSGTTSVTTAGCFVSGATVLVDDEPVVADAEGRLSFEVDLGPPHGYQQYTPAARALEAAGGYWTTKTIAFGQGDP